MEDPDTYDVNSELQRKDARELLSSIISRMTWTGSDIVLDFGTGSGFVTKNILLPLLQEVDNNNTKNGPLIYALDICKKMYDFATSKYPSDNIVYLLGDLTKDGFKMPSKVDKIISSFVFHWISDQVNVLKSMYEVLNLNGEIGIFYAAACTYFDVFPYMARMPKWAEYLTDFEKFVPATHSNPELAKRNLHEALEEIGFTVQECDIIDRKYAYDSFDGITDAFLSINPFISRIPSDLLEEYKMDYCEAFRTCVTGMKSTEHGIELYYSLMVIRARKDGEHIN